MNTKKATSSSKLDSVHLGERLKYFTERAEHGRGLSALSKYLGKSTGSVHHMYKVDDLDFKVVQKVCQYYELTLEEFLGIDGKDMPIKNFNGGSLSSEDIVGTINQINVKIDTILKKLK